MRARPLRFVIPQAAKLWVCFLFFPFIHLVIHGFAVLNGTNFGVDPSLVSVVITASLGPHVCTNVVLLSHTQLTCLSPAIPEAGLSLPVNVTIADQWASAVLISYRGSSRTSRTGS